MAARAILIWLRTAPLAAVAAGASCGGAMAQQRVADVGGLVVSARAAESSFDAPATATAPWAQVIVQAARDNGLPPAFLIRLLNQESTMFTLAVSRAGAMGIAQFMPGTAAARGLDDPFDPLKAIPAAARYLADLRRQLGNIGLAAAAYNAGAGRVTAWLRGTSDLPAETRDYVLRITGFSAEDWAANRVDASAIAPAAPAVPAISSPAMAATAPPAASPASRPAVPRAARGAEVVRKGAKKTTVEAELCASLSASGRGCILQTAY
ncbi:lytic transglycosylase domain-containing protein [Rhodopseudomonas palustris]|uniref:Lytic transglycosylase domain-containing protein n=1 Tax=Rhodopseudomonas palustris TaxID=1076 RepID=A0A323UB70_RHOPL|nr:lytic transglycosylase domain-containing protein [Rhodopseudomonas palustris]PZA10102.1 lytic transglycosylase domain-containing protein [Rhodopseudomonas palustris]